jgi:dephospho-CoA kinase
MKPIIGLTGGIGSGKSEVARLFTLLGAAIYSADEASKYLLDQNSALKERLINAFGDQLYHDYKLNRKAFASLIFNDHNSLSLANSIIHPFVFEDFEKWAQNQPECSYLIMEAAILFESHANEHLNKTITVYTPTELRISRVMKRDGCTREDVYMRMQHQIPDEEKIKMADFVIYNDDQHMLIPQVLELHQQFISNSVQ